jgi:hypothetical protein
MGTKRTDYCYGTSAYMRADEWVDKSQLVHIVDVEDVEFEKGLKPVLKFSGYSKGLVVNGTNFDTLADALGSNPTKWPGHAIILKGEKVAFKGQRVNSIRVSVPKQRQPKQPPSDDPDDGIPDFAA